MARMRTLGMPSVMKVSAAVLAVYLAYAALLYLMQRQMLYPRHMAETRQGAPLQQDGFERIWIESADARCEAWLFMPSSPEGASPVPAVILAHGNAETIDFLPEEFDGFVRMGMALLLVEYPGYGRSGGSPSQRRITDIFLAAYDRLAVRPDIDAGRIVLAGRSLGGGVACRLAAARPSAALVLISAFTSARSFAPRYLLPGFLVKDPFDNLAVVGRYTRPVLVIHGRHDPVIPFVHGEDLARSAPHGRLVAYDCGHNDCPPDPQAFWRDIQDFFSLAGILGRNGP
ncbi:MAG: alpha/beta hydrolase [Desulfobacterales bacterium]|nr:alpha/beta hydrolase [Desulfobacterales bacterium]